VIPVWVCILLSESCMGLYFKLIGMGMMKTNKLKAGIKHGGCCGIESFLKKTGCCWPAQAPHG
jgi:hypothetical protein